MLVVDGGSVGGAVLSRLGLEGMVASRWFGGDDRVCYGGGWRRKVEVIWRF